jgi:hypothetical protein
MQNVGSIMGVVDDVMVDIEGDARHFFPLMT